MPYPIEETYPDGIEFYNRKGEVIERFIIGDKRFYQSGEYLMFGDKINRNSKIIAKVYNPKVLELLIEILNKEENGISDIL